MPQAVATNSSTYTTLATIGSNRGIKMARVRGTIVGAAMTSLRVRTKLEAAGTLRTYLLDADLDVASVALPYSSKTSGGASLYQTADGGTFEFWIDATAIDQILVEAKSAANATITVEVAAG